MGLIAVIEGHGETRGQFGGGLHGKRIWWVVPSYPDATDVWRDLKRAAGSVGVVRELEKRIEFPNGGSVAIKSADNPDSLRGRGLDGVVFDEAAFCTPDTWHRALRPALADRKGWAILLSSPNGKNWFFDLFEHAGADSEWDRWQRPSTDNPLVSQSEVTAASREMGPAAAAQEFGGEFMSVAGAEFPAEWFGEHIWFDNWPEYIRITTISLDPSKGRDAKKGDYSAFVIAKFDHDGIVWVDADLERRDPAKIISDGVLIYRHHRPDGFVVESNQWQELLGGEFDRAFREIGMLEFSPYLIDNYVKKEVRIRRLAAWLNEGRIRFKRGSAGAKMLVEQLSCFPIGHDDGPDALEMAIRLAQQIADEHSTDERTDEYDVAR